MQDDRLHLAAVGMLGADVGRWVKYPILQLWFAGPTEYLSDVDHKERKT